MIRLCEANLCTGCTACSSACPHGCISMQADAEGFVRPVVDETRCIGCGLCDQVCPQKDIKHLEVFAELRKAAEEKGYKPSYAK